MKYKKMPLDRAGAEQWYRELNDDDSDSGSGGLMQPI